jgi:hypothetical protein
LYSRNRFFILAAPLFHATVAQSVEQLIRNQ